tara:strand:- start:3001 stop:3798 length:798 start_codon:yes stop_codon:yes gene_type:complete
MKSIMIVGDGFVGGAIRKALEPHHNVIIQDPPKGYDNGNYLGLIDLDGAIICVPTPSDEEGYCDDVLVLEEYNKIRNAFPTLTILLKSTTSIVTLRHLDSLRDVNLTFSPEFLTASNAYEDLMNSDHMIFANHMTLENSFWSDIFIQALRNVRPVFMQSLVEAGIVKYTVNSFLATKVTFFNEINQLCENLGVSYQRVKLATQLDNRIGTSHMDVPGSDGMRGWGGACFPKDTSEFTLTAEDSASRLELLENVIELNRKHRGENT